MGCSDHYRVALRAQSAVKRQLIFRERLRRFGRKRGAIESFTWYRSVQAAMGHADQRMVGRSPLQTRGPMLQQDDSDWRVGLDVSLLLSLEEDRTQFRLVPKSSRSGYRRLSLLFKLNPFCSTIFP